MESSNVSNFLRATVTRKYDGAIEPPKNIIQTLPAAYQQYMMVRNDHLNRILVYAGIQGACAGNPPYDEEMLAANGLTHISNFNNFKMRAAKDKSAQGYWNLINAVEVYVKVVLSGNNPRNSEWANTIARHFSDVTKEWEDFYNNFNLMGSQLTMYGLCPVFFPHEESPLWEVVDVSRFFIPTQTLTQVSKMTNVCVETMYTNQELFKIYEEATEDGPWNKEALGDFLVQSANMFTQNTRNFMNMLDVQRYVNANEANAMTFYNDNVRLVNMYQKEYDGGISHYIFSNAMYPTNGTNNYLPQSDFLYFVDRQYKKMEDAVIVFTANPGEWLIHDNIGVGQKMFAQSQAVNMLDCSVVDMSRMSSTPIVRTLATGGRSYDPIRFIPGVPTDIGAAEFVQNNLGANIEQVIAASRYLSTDIEMNAVTSGDDPTMPDRAYGSISAGEARGRDFKEYNVLKNVVAHFYNTFDRVIRNVFIRFLSMKADAPGYELAEEFRRRCIEDGVPEELLKVGKKGLYGMPVQFRAVRAARVAGDGSTYARILGLESLDRIVPMFNARELQAYKRDWIEATLGVDYVSTFAMPDSPDEISGGASLAKVENGMITLGQGVLFSPDNDQEAHADEHMAGASEVVKAVAQQQMSPVDADKYMRIMIPHLQEHVAFMNRAPMFYRNVLGKIRDPFNQLVKWAQLNRKNAESMVAAAMRKQQEEAQATQQVMSDAQRKDFMAQRDAERADFKVQKQVERAAQANENRAEVMREKVRLDAQNEAEKNRLMATAKGREKIELMETPPAELEAEMSAMIGNTPSGVDFE
jgi:hypothetical protein